MRSEPLARARLALALLNAGLAGIVLLLAQRALPGAGPPDVPIPPLDLRALAIEPDPHRPGSLADHAIVWEQLDPPDLVARHPPGCPCPACPHAPGCRCPACPHAADCTCPTCHPPDCRCARCAPPPPALSLVLAALDPASARSTCIVSCPDGTQVTLAVGDSLLGRYTVEAIAVQGDGARREALLRLHDALTDSPRVVRLERPQP